MTLPIHISPMSPEEYRATCRALGLDPAGASAAQWLGVHQVTCANYSAGRKPVPALVALALRLRKRLAELEALNKKLRSLD
jgi:hypothetical protein